MIGVHEASATGALGDLSRFRQEFSPCLTAWADALFEVTDAVLCTEGPVTSLAELSLAAEHRRGHGALHDSVNRGRIDLDRFRNLVACQQVPRCEDDRIVLAIDVSNWLRPDANTSAELHDQHGGFAGVGLRHVQQNQALWDLVYNGIAYSVLHGPAPPINAPATRSTSACSTRGSSAPPLHAARQEGQIRALPSKTVPCRKCGATDTGICILPVPGLLLQQAETAFACNHGGELGERLRLGAVPLAGLDRHFYASGLIASDCDVVTVQRALGHSSATITLNTHAHLWPTAEDRSTRNAAAGMLAGVFGDTDEHLTNGERR